MNFIEGLIGRFRQNRKDSARSKKQEEKTLEQERKINGWTYLTFKEYLLALTRGKEFLLPVSEYPQEIELSDDWHQTFDRMKRDTSADGKERWGLIGFKGDQRSLYVPTVAVTGLSHTVPSDVIAQETKRSRQEAKIVGHIGDIHTHPSFGQQPGFSPKDLYNLVQHSPNIQMLVVVESNLNIVAFRTRDTKSLGLGRELMEPDTFQKYWTRWGDSSDANLLEINSAIAKRHNLVLYIGMPGENLLRVDNIETKRVISSK